MNGITFVGSDNPLKEAEAQRQHKEPNKQWRARSR